MEQVEEAFQGEETVSVDNESLFKGEVMDILSKVENYMETRASETARLIGVSDEGVDKEMDAEAETPFPILFPKTLIVGSPNPNDSVLYLLRKYLGEYVHDLSTEALRISVWKGRTEEGKARGGGGAAGRRWRGSQAASPAAARATGEGPTAGLVAAFFLHLFFYQQERKTGGPMVFFLLLFFCQQGRKQGPGPPLLPLLAAVKGRAGGGTNGWASRGIPYVGDLFLLFLFC
ncbi:hypothetical protein Taro_013079 [Colocasia esculenta]|uniref:Uncharacterized protein n=1 Tax=Colocasia esculenta TaxID=4460 RepID=A0A843UL49_COLES|nr:hypothetical protein [Colocasia esculenta]